METSSNRICVCYYCVLILSTIKKKSIFSLYTLNRSWWVWDLLKCKGDANTIHVYMQRCSSPSLGRKSRGTADLRWGRLFGGVVFISLHTCCFCQTYSGMRLISAGLPSSPPCHHRQPHFTILCIKSVMDLLGLVLWIWFDFCVRCIRF